MVWYEFTLRVLLALFLGSLIGTERQLRQRMAGLRTNALVAAGATLFVSTAGLSSFPAEGMRIAAQVVSGIGFLGAGVIMREGLNVRGLNTAATLWCSAAIGVLSGLGHEVEAAIGTFFILIANFILRDVAQRMNRRSAAAGLEVEQVYRINIVCDSAEEVHVRNLLLHTIQGMSPLVLQSLHSEDVINGGKIEVRADVLAVPGHHNLLEQIVSRVSMEKSVSVVRWAVLNGALE
ncbi:MgtC/SapB family protein [Solimicrobium silvestre]|uniref:Protein MgtC n=1 Tax=Solimicrobium silvestre TaxID=2099400 RepID=A0A2S9H518_9BURK|nr:MgtC/SapB family protein [Solimicrobium silvestre]PRC95082.1 putative membrane protein [Solimicrobium silvestre]